ncbi:MAG: PspC domain-containing protein [Firmicutes bacterium]|nr:PspC domain-containing protein [Bacillota bacterium]
MRRLTRSQSNRMLAGVCGGIAEYFGVDATVVRLLWTMLSLLTIWPGIVAYILAWIIVPPDSRY